MELRHRGHRTVWGLIGALPFAAVAVYAITHETVPGSEGGRGPLSAQGLFQQAVRESHDGDRAGTERHLRMALAVIARPDATPNDRRWERRVRTSLAAVVAARGATAEAREIAAPACRMGPDGAAPEDLVSAGLCDR
ncbi:MAG: hypothetical protein Q8S73_02470 [Deltaproteobacteria bacterium]|nr:hypothetical protein [Myxococcales bacterium]MDP3212942.1 hypothetical protein [Deltaproteobacteria bacterium]